MNQRETHSACADQIKKHGGDTPCCACTGHECKPVTVSYCMGTLHDAKECGCFRTDEYTKGYNKALSDVLSMLPHDVPERWRMRFEGLRIDLTHTDDKA